jgi:hypothetical protein
MARKSLSPMLATVNFRPQPYSFNPANIIRSNPTQMPHCFPEHKLYTSLVVLDPDTANRYRSIEELLGMHFLHMNLVNEKNMRKSRKARHTGNENVFKANTALPEAVIFHLSAQRKIDSS